MLADTLLQLYFSALLFSFSHVPCELVHSPAGALHPMPTLLRSGIH
jgi:hypothetical protein